MFSLVILCISVHCAASDNQVCRVEERLNMGLSKIDAPATILSVVYDYHSAPDCYQACCNYTGSKLLESFSSLFIILNTPWL